MKKLLFTMIAFSLVGFGNNLLAEDGPWNYEDGSCGFGKKGCYKNFKRK